MTYDEFRALPEDEQRAAYISSESLTDLEAERDSLKNENMDLRAQNKEIRDSEKKTKEMNYTLVRKLSLDEGKAPDPCEILNNMFN